MNNHVCIKDEYLSHKYIIHGYAKISKGNIIIIGNGKIDRTPTPQGIRKIKRVSFEAFLRLKKLVKVFKVYDSIVHKRY
ncbi:MAG: hypothetical protein Q7O04_01980, partial [Candidatus Omnitrophota bacterium]|nr:hypothetical protein [Candidatus Omnitrophota bacterium]